MGDQWGISVTFNLAFLTFYLFTLSYMYSRTHINQVTNWKPDQSLLKKCDESVHEWFKYMFWKTFMFVLCFLIRLMTATPETCCPNTNVPFTRRLLRLFELFWTRFKRTQKQTQTNKHRNKQIIEFRSLPQFDGT